MEICMTAALVNFKIDYAQEKQNCSDLLQIFLFIVAYQAFAIITNVIRKPSIMLQARF